MKFNLEAYTLKSQFPQYEHKLDYSLTSNPITTNKQATVWDWNCLLKICICICKGTNFNMALQHFFQLLNGINNSLIRTYYLEY